MHPLAHMLAGALIGQLAPTPAVALAGGVVSHFVLDGIPHTEGNTFRPRPPHTRRVIGVDLIEPGLEFVVGIAIVVWLTSTCHALHTQAVGLGVFGALLPDFIDVPLGLFWQVSLLHAPRLHSTVKRRHAVWGILTQLAVIVAAASYLWRGHQCR